MSEMQISGFSLAFEEALKRVEKAEAEVEVER